ncbi:MAG: DegT/DnrJ/EryC1/StrS family aminotransferase [Oscillospiraceae bacterium]|nr:DegT/DnrJ/EryC1/StrS family aminotransferase [Oscillospiraceae bacterium]
MSKEKTPLAHGVEVYIEKKMSRLHMPGHKGAKLTGMGKLTEWDVTEIEETDSLYEASGIIRCTEDSYSRLYGTVATLLSAGGSTLCIQTMLALAARPNGKIIAGRNIHSAAVNAMALLGLEPVWVYPRKSEDEPFIGRIHPDDIKTALMQHPDAAAVYITSPDYFGVISDIAAISKLCRSCDVPLLVDNAHGAHLRFLDTPVPLHPIQLGADMCCDSLHKTMPVITGGALLHIGSSRFASRSRAKNCMSMFGSTSPSYLIMLSADRCLTQIKEDLPKRMNDTVKEVQKLRELALQKGFAVPDMPCDPMRLTLGLSTVGITAKEFDRHLKSHKIQAEFISDSGCVLLFSPYNSEEDINRVRKAILTAPVTPAKAVSYPILSPKSRMSLRQAVLSESVEIPADEAAGRIAAKIQAPCPPGIPLIMPGEEITAEDIPILKNYGITTLQVVVNS